METTYIVLLVLLAIYIPLYIFVRKSEKAHEKGFVPYGPTIMIKTSWGLRLMDRLGKYRRFWHFMGTVSLGVSLVLAIAIISILVIDLTLLPSVIGKGGLGIEYALAIPGLNPILPITYGIIGLVFAMVIHEMAHGIQSRANDIKVNSSGILYGVVPLGAFVEPDEEETEKASRRARMHVYAAGITTNTFAAILLFGMLVFGMTGGIACDYEDNAAVYSVVDGTVAYEYNIETTSIITHIDGVPVTLDGLTDVLKQNTSDTLQYYDVTFLYKNTETVHNMPLGVCVSSVISDSPAKNLGISKGMFITKMDSTVINVPGDFVDFMSTTNPGQDIVVTYYDLNKTQQTATVTLSDGGDSRYFGVATTISGFSFITPESILEMGTNPFYGRDGFRDQAMGLISFISQPFKGFSPIPESTTWWFHSTTFLSDEAFWIIIWIVYWCFWLNIVLAVSNALPAVPFDGGLLLFCAGDWFFEKIGMKDEKKREEYVNKTCSVISYSMIFIMVIVLVAIIF